MGFDFATQIDLKQSTVSRLYGAGGMVQPDTPSFYAYKAGTYLQPAPGWAVFDTVVYNIGSGYNPANGLFTAPCAGVYYFFGQFLLDFSPVGESSHALYKNSALYPGGVYTVHKVASYHATAFCGGHIQMAAGDYVGLYRTRGLTSYQYAYGEGFGGHLVS